MSGLVSFLRRRSPTPSLDDKVIGDYRAAGKIAKEALGIAKESSKEGTRAIDIADKVEGHILSRGAKCAFPINICINHIAAHYTPKENDPLVFARGDVIKFDVGVHVNGYIADTASTIEISTSNWTSLIKASENALACALEMLVPDIGVSSIGAAVETAICDSGFKPVSNLTGHTLEKNLLHAGVSVPNVATKESSTLRAGTAVAIEPFATDGSGYVDNDKAGNIYRIIGARRLSDELANKFLESASKDLDHLPFASRWCSRYSSNYESLIRKHWRHRNISSYAILSEKPGTKVSQAEHSVLILDDSLIVYTR